MLWCGERCGIQNATESNQIAPVGIIETMNTEPFDLRHRTHLIGQAVEE